MTTKIDCNSLLEGYVRNISKSLVKAKDRECKRLVSMGITDITIVEFTHDPYKWFISVGEKEYQARLNIGEGI